MDEDVLTEILARLPCRSLARFQCVSTSWRRIISSDYLRRRLPLITSGVLYHDGGRRQQSYTYACASGGGGGGGAMAEAADMRFFPRHETSTIIDGCNGLLLYYASRPAAFHVVSPTTRRWAELPAPRAMTLLSVLAFDPRASPRYRVVCFTGWLPRGATVEVFDSERGAWRGHELDFGLGTDAMSASMHYAAGALHVLAYSGHVVRVDLDTMACAVTPLPAPVSCRARRALPRPTAVRVQRRPAPQDLGAPGRRRGRVGAQARDRGQRRRPRRRGVTAHHVPVHGVPPRPGAGVPVVAVEAAGVRLGREARPGMGVRLRERRHASHTGLAVPVLAPFGQRAGLIRPACRRAKKKKKETWGANVRCLSTLLCLLKH